MEFKTKDFLLTLEKFNKKLGISEDIEIDWFKDNSYVRWSVDIGKSNWGIAYMKPIIEVINITIDYSILLSDLNGKEIDHLFSLDLGEFYPCEENGTYINGKIVINATKYVIKNLMELAGDSLEINEVIINFDDYIITIL